MTNENDSGWDSLADELGIEPSKPAPHAEPPARPKSEPARSAPRRPERDPRPEIEQEAADFGAGVVEEPIGSAETIYDPGAGSIADDELEEPGAETYEDVHEGYEPPGESESEAEGQEGGKRRRRRRRRRKKGGPEGEETPADIEKAENDAEVEEGEAPAEVEGDDDDEAAPPSAMEQELEEESILPRPEWHVMTWMELVGKLHRPG